MLTRWGTSFLAQLWLEVSPANTAVYNVQSSTDPGKPNGATGSVATAASVEFSAPKLQICWGSGLLGGFHVSQKTAGDIPNFGSLKTQVHPKFRSECSLRILHIFWTSPFPSDVTVFRYRNFRSFPKGYLAGVTVDALVQLRDQFGNNRTSSSPTLLFQALVEGELQRD